jgi:aminoglycoside phosphotransferase (APT) family kinase protein
VGLRFASVTGTDDEITADLIAELLREQHPDLAGLPLRFGARGWDNQLWRLGDDLAVRLPWATQDAGELLLKEHAFLPAIAPRLPLPVPVPQRLGQPSGRFPRPWIVTTWVAGEPADRAPATRGAEAVSITATRRLRTRRPCAALAAGR